MEWVLIVFVHVGIWGNTDSVALTNVPMASQEACESAGSQLGVLVSGTKKEVAYVCVKNQ
jgi:hypothetical protein